MSFRYVDFLNLMTISFDCDVNGTEMNAPLYPRHDQLDKTCNVVCEL